MTRNHLTPSQIDERIARHPELCDRIHRTLLMELHSRGLATIDEIYREARSRALHSTIDEELPGGDNVQIARRWDEEERQLIQMVTVERAAELLTTAEVDDLINLTRKRHQAQTLEEVASLATVPFGLLAGKVRDFCRLPVGLTILPEQESMSVRLALIRRLISEQLEFQAIAKHHLRIRDFSDLVNRIIGSDTGAGLIGGKAAGMLLGSRILQDACRRETETPSIRVAIPDSFYVRSDVMDRFLSHNGLQHLKDHKYKDPEEIHNDYPMLLQLFKNAEFPPGLVEQLEQMLRRVGRHPLIVRSSSLLEDRFGATFAGKYRSVFVCNQGSDEQRLNELLGAIAEVYASSLHPDPIRYRRRLDLIDYDESMAVLIQKLVGSRVGRYFLPLWAGVGFSRNPSRRNPRIRPEDGMARLVFGLGTRAVDRVATDTPRIIPLGMPALRPEVTDADVLRAAQSQVDVIDIEANRFDTVPVPQVLAQPGMMANLGQVMSVLEHGVLRPLIGDGLSADADDLVVTFDGLARSSPYPAFLRWCLQTLERAYGCPVDIELAFDGSAVHLLQCRTQAVRRSTGHVALPTHLPPERVVFSATRDVLGGTVHDIRYVVLIDPRDYNQLPSDDRRISVGQVVREINRLLEGQRFALMGPGRWGSRDMRMGVRVGYSDIDQCCLLVEIARRQGGYVPEVSFGSHFFQDLVESDIKYLSLYPDDPGQRMDEAFFQRASVLEKLLPHRADFADVVRVIDIPAVSGGMFLQVDMDEERQLALGTLAPPASAGG